LPSGPELSKTRLTTFPTVERLRFCFDRERCLFDLMMFFYPAFSLALPEPLPRAMREVFYTGLIRISAFFGEGDKAWSHRPRNTE